MKSIMPTTRRRVIATLAGLSAVPFGASGAVSRHARQDKIDMVLETAKSLGSSIVYALLLSPFDEHDRYHWNPKCCGPLSTGAFAAVLWKSRSDDLIVTKDELRSGLTFDAMERAIDDETLPDPIRRCAHAAMLKIPLYREHPRSYITRDTHGYIEILSAIALTVMPTAHPFLRGVVRETADMREDLVNCKQFSEEFDVAEMQLWRRRIEGSILSLGSS